MEKLDSKTPIQGLEKIRVGDFWAWAYSDVLSNRNRAIFAEYLVALALKATDKPRIEWDAADVTYDDKKIEVKSAAYVQSWSQNEESKINFDIAKKKSWDAESNTYSDVPTRVANCYVFCLYVYRQKDPQSVLDVRNWRFYVLTTREIDNNFGEQKSLSLGRLEKVTKSVQYGNLRSEILRALE